MGLYYSGDIQGKLLFGVQCSDDASFFGGSTNERNYIEYYFGECDLPSINEGVEQCEKQLGVETVKLDTFFAEHESYTNEQLAEYLGLKDIEKRTTGHSFSKLHEILIWYARLQLGKKILACVTEKGECCFEAEL